MNKYKVIINDDIVAYYNTEWEAILFIHSKVDRMDEDWRPGDYSNEDIQITEIDAKEVKYKVINKYFERDIYFSTKKEAKKFIKKEVKLHNSSEWNAKDYSIKRTNHKDFEWKRYFGY